MWPSEEAASRLYDLANGGLILAAVIAVISTVSVVWLGNKKEGYLKVRLGNASSVAAQANERAAHLENDNLKLSGSVAVLQQSASDAEAAQQVVETELEKQRERTAQAEEKLLTLTKKQAPRQIPKGALSSLLTGKAVGTVRVLYQPDDTEAFQFGMTILGELSAAGWTNTGLARMPDNASLVTTWPVDIRGQMSQQSLEQERQLLPISVRAGGGSGLTLIATSIQPDQPKDGAYEVLRGALLSINLQLATRPDATLPENSFIIVVGPKP